MQSRLCMPSGRLQHAQNHSVRSQAVHSVQCVALAFAQSQHNRAAGVRAAAVTGPTAADPPDVVPDVLLLLQSDLQHQSLTNLVSPDSSTDIESGKQQQFSQVQQGQQQQQHKESMLIPKTSSRLKGLAQLPGFIPCLALQPDPHLVVRQQEALEAWQAAAAWVKQQHSQPSQQQLDPADTFQQLLTQHLAHWAPLAAVLQAAGLQLGLSHLQQLTEALHTLLERSSSSSSSGSSSTSISSGSAAASWLVDGSADMFVPDVMVLSVPSNWVQQQQQQQGSFDACGDIAGVSTSSSSTSSNVSGSSNGYTQVVLECKALLPHLCQLLLTQLQPLQPDQLEQQEDVESSGAQLDSTTNNSSSSSSRAPDASRQLVSSAGGRLLQQLAALHSSGSVGPADPQLVAVLVDLHIQLQDCTLQELASLLSSCAKLGHPHKSSWLQQYVSTAQQRLEEAVQQHVVARGTENAASAGPSSNTSSSSSSSSSSNSSRRRRRTTTSSISTTTPASPSTKAVSSQRSEELQAFTATVAQLLEAVARYPGPHADAETLKPFLSAVQPHLPLMSPANIQTLGTAVAALQLKPGAAWRHAVASAALDLFPSCSSQQLVQLLLGVTAGGYNPQEHWWRGWFAATIRKFETLFGAHTGADWAPATATAAAADGGGDSDGSGSDKDSWDGVESAAADSSSSSSSGNVDSVPEQQQYTSDSEQAAPSKQQQQKQQQLDVSERLPAALLSTVCLVLLQLGRQVHPLWMAGMLEAYLRGITQAELASTPQLLLLCSRLLEGAPAFAVRYKPLMLRLMSPLQHNFNLLNPEQMAQAAEVCAVYCLNITTEWYRWHGAAILRLGKTFPLEALARVREAYRTQEVPSEQQLQQLLSTVPWRLQRLQEQQQREARRDAKKATIGFKMDQRRRQNIADAEKKAAASSGDGSIGMGLKGPGGRDNWRKRKLKPPGTLGRKF